MLPAGADAEQKADFAIWNSVNQSKWGFISCRDNCLQTTIFHIKLPPLRQLRGVTVMKGVQKQKHLITPFFCLPDHLCSSRCWNGSPPLKRLSWGVLHVLTEESFILFTPELACHIYRWRLSLCPSGASGQLKHLYSSWMFWWHFWPLIGCSHKFNSPCCKDSQLPVTTCKRTHTRTQHHTPELIEAEIQSSCKMAICVSQEVWDVFAIMSDEGNLQEKKKGSKFKQCSIA